MGKPSLFQTLFRQPSQSYASTDSDSLDRRRTLRGTRSTSSLYSNDGASIRSGIWDWTNSGSTKHAGLVAHTNEHRLGTTDQYIRNSRSAATLNLESYDERREFDMRSVRSLTSMRSSYRQGGLETGLVPAAPKERSRRSSTKGWETGASRRYSGIDVPSDSTPSSSTSRHYASSSASINSTPSSSVVSSNRISPRSAALAALGSPVTDSEPPSPTLRKRKSSRSMKEEVVSAPVEVKVASPLSNVSRFAELEDVDEEVEEEEDNQASGRNPSRNPSRISQSTRSVVNSIPSAPPSPTSPVISYVSLTITPPTPQAKIVNTPLARSELSTSSIPSAPLPVTTPTMPLPVSPSPTGSKLASHPNCNCGTKPSLPTPRINLTRTESDQATAGVLGAVELSYDTATEHSVESPSNANTLEWPRSTTTLDSPPVPLSEATRRYSAIDVAPPIPLSTRPPSLSKLTTANLATTVAPPLSNQYDSVVLETPRWLKSIRSLGEPIEIPPFSPSSSTRRQVTPSRAQSISSSTSYDRLAAMGDGDKKKVSRRRTKSQGLTSTGPSGRTAPTIQPALPSRSASSNQIYQLSSPISSPLISPIVSPSLSAQHSPSQSRPTTPASIPPISSALLRSPSLASEMSRSPSGLSASSIPLGAFRSVSPRFSIAGTEALKSLSATMTTLSISAGATAALFRPSSFFRRFRPAERELPTHLRAQSRFLASRDMKFGASQPPPAKLKHDEVLLDVIAVALDRSDLERVVELSGTEGGYGYIPGRSFCGRVIECGMSIDRLKRGDYVFGLADLKKSGALAELMTINRDLVTLAPDCDISVEQIAALPLSLHAVQAMESICNELPKGSKILILGAHEGAGSLALQLAEYFRATRDLWIVAQAPADSRSTLQDELERLGASDVALEAPLSLMNHTLAASSFDVVFDTIGGREVFVAGRRVLHAEGRFVTTVGDSVGIEEVRAHWKLGMRSLKRSFVKKDQKSISYWAVNLDTRENPREALEKLRGAVERSGVRPPISRILQFEESSLAFAEDSIAGTVVRMH